MEPKASSASVGGKCLRDGRQDIDGRMIRYLFIVSRDHLDVFWSLRNRFKNDARVEVILDRRRGPAPEAADPERRGRPQVDAELEWRPYSVVVIS